MDNLRKWNIYLRDKNEWGSVDFLHDIVFFDQKMTAPEIYNSLVNYDRYEPNIKLCWTHTDENEDIIHCGYPSEYYEEGDEYDKECIIKNVIPWE